MEVLCNACGLYWKHHNTYRPLALKAAADRKSTTTMLPSNNGGGQRSSHPLAYTNPQISQFYVNYNHENQDNDYQVNFHKFYLYCISLI